MGKLLPRIQVLALALLVAGLANGVLLGAFYSDAERAVLGALSVGLEPGRVLQDPYQLAIHLQGLESSGLMDCTKASRQLKQQSVVVYDSSFRGNCGGHWQDILVPFRKVSVVSSSGEPWTVSFKPTLKRSQIWSLVLANLLLAASAGAAVGWYRSHTKKRIQEQQSEIEGLRLIQNVFTQIAHDVRAPLAALQAVTSTLGPEANDEKQVLISAAQRIRGIAQGLIEMKLYRPITPSTPAQARARPVSLVEVRDFIDELLIEKRSRYRQRSEIEFHLVTESIAQHSVALDFVSLGRVLSNLIENSVESTSAAGKIEIYLSSPKNQLLIEVRDHGGGIDSKLLPRLARPGATFGKENGTGLGLYHARVYFESLGGTFRIESQINRGTQIFLSVPLLKTKVTEASGV